MPRGFLVKRTQKHHDIPPIIHRTHSDDDRSESGSGSDLDTPLLIHTAAYQHPYGSPDSGFSQSPVNLTTKTSNRNVDVTRSEDSQSDCNSTSEKNTFTTDTASVSDLDDAPGRIESDTLENISPKSTVSSPPSLTSVSSQGYGIPSRVMQSPLSISTSMGSSPSFYFSAFDRLAVTSPKGHRFHHGAPFMPGPGMFPGYPPMAMPNRILLNPPVSPANNISPNKRKNPEHTETGLTPKTKSMKKPKAARKIQFDEDKSSPVSGTIIRDASDVDEDSGIRVVSGDIDASLNFVEVTPEAREEISRIENKIGAYVCQLCKEHYDDAFQLAQHRCSRIIHVEYRCPECDKVFNCPANLASHRRWHKPKPTNNNGGSNINNNGTNNNNNNNKAKGTTTVLKTTDAKRALDAINGNITNGHLHPAMFVDNMNKMMLGRGVENMLHNGHRRTSSPEDLLTDNEGLFECDQCGKKFRRQAYLRKHIASHADGEPSLACPVCNKLFKGESARTKHVLQFHNNLSPPTPMHMEQRSAGDPRGEYTCALCGHHMNSQLDLEGHQRHQHPNEIYACKYCTAVFYSSPGLTRHINKCHPSENRQVILLHMPPMPQINSPC